MGFLSSALGFASGALDLFGSSAGMRSYDTASKDIKSLPGMSGPQGVSGNFGSVNTQGQFAMDPQMLAMQQALGMGGMGFLGGGYANDPGLQQALMNNDIAGALGQANQALGVQQGASAFGGLGGLYGSLQGQVAGGPQDVSGGLMGNLFAQGFGNQLAAGNQSAIFDQSLASQRAAAAPMFQRQQNQLQDQLFAKGLLGQNSTATGDAFRGMFEAQNQADLGFQNNAFGQAMQQQNFLANLGSSQIGQGQGFLGQGLSQYNQNIGNMMGIEGLGFNQSLSANQFNTSQGMNRLAQAQGLLGFGGDLAASQYGIGLQGAQGMLGFGQFGLGAARSPFELQASLLGASGYHAQALGDLAAGRGQAQEGFFGGLAESVKGLI